MIYLILFADSFDNLKFIYTSSNDNLQQHWRKKIAIFLHQPWRFSSLCAMTCDWTAMTILIRIGIILQGRGLRYKPGSGSDNILVYSIFCSENYHHKPEVNNFVLQDLLKAFEKNFGDRQHGILKMLHNWTFCLLKWSSFIAYCSCYSTSFFYFS